MVILFNIYNDKDENGNGNNDDNNTLAPPACCYCTSASSEASTLSNWTTPDPILLLVGCPGLGGNHIARLLMLFNK